MSSQDTLQREARTARQAAIAGLAGVVVYIASTIAERSSGLSSSGGKGEQLRSFHDHASTLLVVSITSAIGLLLLIVPLLYLFRAAKARNPRVRPEMVAFVFIGLGFFAAQIVVSWFASNDIANTFLHTVAGHKNPDDFAQKVIDASSLAKWATGLLVPAVVGMIVAIVYTALQATRAGLLTRFWGTLGMALGATMLLVPPLALFALVLWFGWLSLLIGGWTRSGRPPAWAAGEAIPWLKPGEEPKPAAAPGGGAKEAGGNGVVEGEARPVPSERRKRKKRQ